MSNASNWQKVRQVSTTKKVTLESLSAVQNDTLVGI